MPAIAQQAGRYAESRPSGLAADAFSHVVGTSPFLREAVELARCVAQSPLTTVLLQGETGTGKELFARGIHAASRPAGEPFVAVNCAAIPHHLLEAELFGHEKGAFTGAVGRAGLLDHASTGTLFLDEIQQLPAELQAKLLRIVEDRSYRLVGGTAERSVDCRIIAGANVNLEQAVLGGRFRSDLFFRLNVFSIELPPLRERKDDIVPLAEHFLGEIATRDGRPAKTLHDRTRRLLQQHAWPGNAREVRNVMERANLLAPANTVLPSHLRLQRRETVSFSEACGVVGHIAIPSTGKALATIEREAIRLTMILTEGNVSAASRILGITRPTLLRKMRAGGITRRSLLASS